MSTRTVIKNTDKKVTRTAIRKKATRTMTTKRYRKTVMVNNDK